jgi:hypothetical protein
MRVFQDVIMRSKSLPAKEIISNIEDFATKSPGWENLSSRSEEYASAISKRACIIHALPTETSESAAVALAETGLRTVKITNIVPETKTQLTMDEYNSIAKRFKSELIKYVHSQKKDIKVWITGETIGLNDIIRGKKTREFFQKYLNAYPKSWHPLDVRRLDTFICAMSRYACDIDLDRLGGFLISDLGWPREDVQRCCERIKIGSEVLELNRRF